MRRVFQFKFFLFKVVELIKTGPFGNKYLKLKRNFGNKSYIVHRLSKDKLSEN